MGTHASSRADSRERLLEKREASGQARHAGTRAYPAASCDVA